VVTGRQLLLGNDDVVLAVAAASRTSPLYRNAVGDELVFVERGSAVVESVFGRLAVAAGDYVVIPTGTTHRWVVDGPSNSEPLHALVLEARGHVRPPRRYLSTDGQFLEHAPYCERDLHVPTLPLTYDESGDHEVRIKARGFVHRYVYDYHPIDIVGWDGCYYPYTFNVDDFAPITGQLHMPPPIHQTFEAHNFVICSFCPRALDFHPDAIPVPYNHSNLDSDEVLYYVEGNYKARRGIEVGSITAHPQGIPHGPHPGTVERSLGAKWTNELAVMCDTFRPLHPTAAAIQLDDAAYPASWRDEHFPQLIGAHASNGQPNTVEDTSG
jgi:homogentisate 1,2-dioxygenase